MRILWFSLLVSAICLEGLGRRYLPAIPSAVFYFFKDAVLLVGWYAFRPPERLGRLIRHLYRGFGAILVAALVWTVLEIFNPEQQSVVLGLIGLRAYWLWWLAPPVIATVLQDPREKRRAIYVLLALCIAIAALAIAQFAAPPTSALNMYSVVEGEEVYADQAVVGATGRARVASTFSFLTGFSAFTVLVPAILLSIGLEAKTRRVRLLALAAAMICAAVLPMSGSRATILLGAGVLAITLWSAGLFLTQIGRRVLLAAVGAAILSVVAFPDAFIGVQSRFEGDSTETNSRFKDAANILPPVALATLEYPILGIGTGMQQNAHVSMHIYTKWETEGESARYLVELGAPGFLLIWLVKVGAVVALWRAYQILKRAGRRGPAGAALSYAALTMVGALVFDHVWQALYFLGCGFILSEVLAVVGVSATNPQPVTAMQVTSPSTYAA